MIFSKLLWSFQKHIPIIKNVSLSHSMSSFPSVIAAHKQASPAQTSVAQKSHFLPTFIIMYIAIPIAGISTRPARACLKREINQIELV